MTEGQWEAFVAFREVYRAKCNEWASLSLSLMPLQQKAAARDTPFYPIENPIVYNTFYDTVKKDDRISILLVGDNPGKEEQLQKNRSYLVGQSGRIAEGFFRRNSFLGIDFRKNVLILNKTPVHTAKTAHLKLLLKDGGTDIARLIYKSQIETALLTATLHKALIKESSLNFPPPLLWLVGYAELKGNGVFIPYKEKLYESYFNGETKCMIEEWNKVFVFQHFSMNRFIIDLKKYRSQYKKESDEYLAESLRELGNLHKKEIF